VGRSRSPRSPAVGWEVEVEGMEVTLGTSTGAKIVVWREKDLFHARRIDRREEPQTCWAVDLFEVIAELAQFDLDDPAQAAEALRLAARAQRRLRRG
jgi:Alpha/beta hydrolase domain